MASTAAAEVGKKARIGVHSLYLLEFIVVCIVTSRFILLADVLFTSPSRGLTASYTWSSEMHPATEYSENSP